MRKNEFVKRRIVNEGNTRRDSVGKFERVAVWLLAVCVGAIVSGCRDAEKKDVPQAEPPKVTVASPITMELVRWSDTFKGYLESRDFVTIRSQISGRVEEICFEDGSEVKKGDPLVKIDPRMFVATVESTKASLAKAQANSDLMKAELDRCLALRESGATTQADQDSAQANYDESLAQIQVQEAALAQANLNLEYTVIVAPMDGLVDRHQASVGDMITAGQTPIVEITSVDPIDAYLSIDENSLRKLQAMTRNRPVDENQKVPVYFRLVDEMDSNSPEHVGVASFSGIRINSSTGTILVWVSIENPKNAAGRREFVPGMFVRARIPLSAERIKKVLVPETAIGSSQNLKYLLVVGEDGVVESRFVKLGAMEGELRVIEEGVTPQDRIVINGLLRARPGAKVTPEEGVIEPPAETTVAAPVALGPAAIDSDEKTEEETSELSTNSDDTAGTETTKTMETPAETESAATDAQKEGR